MVMSFLPDFLEQFGVFVRTNIEGSPLELLGVLWLSALSVFALK